MDGFEKAFPPKYSPEWCLKIKNEDPPMWRVRLAVLFFVSAYVLSGYVCGGMVINILRGVGLISGLYLLWAAESLGGRVDRARSELGSPTAYLNSIYFFLPKWRHHLILGTIFYLWLVYSVSGYICDGVAINTLRVVGGAGGFYLLFEARALVGRLHKARNELWIASSHMMALQKKRNL